MGKIKDKLIAAEEAVKSVVTKTEDKVKADLAYVNSTLLNFPTDIHNLTGELKSTMLRLASRINGQEDKFKLYIQTLEICMKHIEAKFLERKDHLETMFAAEKQKAEDAKAATVTEVKTEETKVETAVADVKKDLQ